MAQRYSDVFSLPIQMSHGHILSNETTNSYSNKGKTKKYARWPKLFDVTLRKKNALSPWLPRRERMRTWKIWLRNHKKRSFSATPAAKTRILGTFKEATCVWLVAEKCLSLMTLSRNHESTSKTAISFASPQPLVVRLRTIERPLSEISGGGRFWGRSENIYGRKSISLSLSTWIRG